MRLGAVIVRDAIVPRVFRRGIVGMNIVPVVHKEHALHSVIGCAVFCSVSRLQIDKSDQRNAKRREPSPPIPVSRRNH
jgi:hypothetical protein